ncbi:mycofactocin biosynthesis chaperone MftB [Gordonia soli]|uniref:Mycofactocin system protein MftB n=1 Tax=Gordonia soli NBRC 108243 TaxID=1223545 RepID=M0QGT3_9ACTN|nr:mycofactocin biosynthesis chaperone MftB [Gordonia soli]GAC67768.1 hypothetical protein GS4_11_00360 [Gordonia soli NBRC 108243]
MSTPTTTTVDGGRGDATAGHRPSPTFDLLDAWQLNPKVALRPEPFGALLYHFGTRKLSFLKNLVVVDIVASLADHPNAEAALLTAGIDPASRGLYLQALTALAESGMIIRR